MTPLLEKPSFRSGLEGQPRNSPADLIGLGGATGKLSTGVLDQQAALVPFGACTAR